MPKNTATKPTPPAPTRAQIAAYLAAHAAGGRSKGASKQSAGDAPLSKASKKTGPRKPREVHNKGSRTIIFEEYVQDIAGSVSFSAASFPVQVGLPTLFAWLATQAISYQEAAFERLGFRFESEVAADKTGKLMLSFLPDAADPVPATKQEMLEVPDKAKCKIWEDCQMFVNTADALGKRRFIRSGDLASNLDIKTYDQGQLIVATQGCADTSAIGELYVMYSVTLYTPVISANVWAKSVSCLFTAASPSASSLLGTTPVKTGSLLATATGNTITFQRVGLYILAQTCVGTGLFTSFVPVVGTSTATVTRFSGVSNAAANAGTVAVSIHYVTVTVRGQTVVLDCSTQATTITGGSVSIGSGFLA